MINVAELMQDPDLAQPFQVERSAGAFANEGEWVAAAPTVIPLVGIVQPANRDSLAFLPEGTRLGNTIMVMCDQELRIDDADATRSDVIVWHGNPYRVINAKPWKDHGFWQVWAEGFVR